MTLFWRPQQGLPPNGIRIGVRLLKGDLFSFSFYHLQTTKCHKSTELLRTLRLVMWKLPERSQNLSSRQPCCEGEAAGLERPQQSASFWWPTEMFIMGSCGDWKVGLKPNPLVTYQCQWREFPKIYSDLLDLLFGPLLIWVLFLTSLKQLHQNLAWGSVILAGFGGLHPAIMKPQHCPYRWPRQSGLRYS